MFYPVGVQFIDFSHFSVHFVRLDDVEYYCRPSEYFPRRLVVLL